MGGSGKAKMTKDEAIKIVVQAAKRNPDPEPCPHGYPEDFGDDYRDWLDRTKKVREAINLLETS